MQPSLKCSVYAISRAAFGFINGMRGLDGLSYTAALQTFYSPYWPLLLTYRSNEMCL